MAKIAIDLHGGDFGPSVLIPTALHYFRCNPHHHGVLFGDMRIGKSFSKNPPDNIEWVDTDSLDPRFHSKPSKLLRNASTSSIEIATQALANGDVDAIVSAEHTGVLLTLMTKYGHLHPALERPVLTSWLPSATGKTLMLDLGASFSATCEQLMAFASVGVGMVACQGRKPKVALLNIGTEAFKGPLQLRLAFEQLSLWSCIEFVGFIEPSELYSGSVDIVVTDGFTGNTAIKSAEGALTLAMEQLKAQFSARFIDRLMGLILRQRLNRALHHLNPDRANGALIAGCELTMIKSHGHAKGIAFQAAIDQAVELSTRQVTALIWQQLEQISI